MKELYIFHSTFGAFHLGEDISGKDRKELKNINELLISLEPYYKSEKYVLVARSFPKEDLEIFKMELQDKYPGFEIKTKSRRDKS